MRMLITVTIGILFVSWVYAEVFQVGVHWKNEGWVPKRLAFKFTESTYRVDLVEKQELHLQPFPHHEALDNLIGIELQWEEGMSRWEFNSNPLTLNLLDNSLPLLNIYLGGRPRRVFWKKPKL